MKSLFITMVVSFAGTFSYAKAYGQSFETACYFAVCGTCAAIFIHRMIRND